MATNRRKPTMVVDFDGIIYDYDQHGWNGIDKIEGLPLEDAKESLDRLSKAYNIVVYSSRCQEPRGRKAVGRCRRHAPTMNGYPVVYKYDWCGDHKLDETVTI